MNSPRINNLRPRRACLGVVVALLVVLSSCSRLSQPTSEATPAGTARTEVDRGPVTVSLQVEPAPARLSDLPTLTLTIESSPGVRIEKPPFGDGIGDFLIRDFREPLPEVREQREIVRQVYTLEPTRTGKLIIDPITVVFHDERPQGDGKSHRIETDPLEVTVESVVEGELPSLDDLQGLAEPVAIEGPGLLAGRRWLLAIPVAVAGLALIGWWWRKNRGAAPPRALTPYEVALQELTALEAAETANRDVKQFYVALTGIVRRYIESTTSVQAAEQTTEEFLREISAGDRFERAQRERLKSFLESADLVKFAAHQPSDHDIDEALARARDFIRPPAEAEK